MARARARFAVLPLVAACGSSIGPQAAMVSAPTSTAAVEPEPVVSAGPPFAAPPPVMPVAVAVSAEPACEAPPSGAAPAALSTGGRAAWAQQPFLPMSLMLTKMQSDEHSFQVSTPSAPNRPALLLQLANDLFQLEAHGYQACIASLPSTGVSAVQASTLVERSHTHAGESQFWRLLAIRNCTALALHYPSFAAAHFCPTS
jgi:hypothetical protein